VPPLKKKVRSMNQLAGGGLQTQPCLTANDRHITQATLPVLPVLPIENERGMLLKLSNVRSETRDYHNPPNAR
jgi:hypothetical protein